jgi:uncharacterized membrane protein
MASVAESIDVEVPVSTAYNQWTQFESFPQFMSGVERIEQSDDTHLHWVTSMEWQPEGLTEKAGAMLGSDDRQVKSDLSRFKDFIESRGGETGAWRGEVNPSS